MDRILIVSSNQKSIDVLASLVKKYSGVQIITTTSAAKARRYSSSSEVSVAIINTPLMEEFGTELAYDLSQKGVSPILIVKSSLVEDITADVERTGILVLQKPIIKNLFYQYLNVQMSVKTRLIGLRKENDKLKNRIEEIKTIDRAKLILMEMENLSEGSAHRSIEKLAMDTRKSRYETSLEILRKYHQI